MENVENKVSSFSLNLNLVHYVIEAVALCGITFYFYRKHQTAMKHIEELAKKCNELQETIDRHEEVLQKIVSKLRNEEPQPVEVYSQSYVSQAQAQRQTQPQAQAQRQTQPQAQQQQQAQAQPQPSAQAAPMQPPQDLIPPFVLEAAKMLTQPLMAPPQGAPPQGVTLFSQLVVPKPTESQEPNIVELKDDMLDKEIENELKELS